MADPRPSEVRSALATDLGALLESGRAADITLEVSGSRLVAHRAILAARSPVFRKDLKLMTVNHLRNDMPLGGNEEDVWKQMLQFMYTDHVPQLCTYDIQLLTLATVFCIPQLKKFCEDSLARKITIDNAAEFAVLAIKYFCTRLKDIAIKFLRSHKEVFSTPGWKKMNYDDPQRVAEISSLIAAKPTKNSMVQSPPRAQPGPRGCLVEDMAALLRYGAVADVALVAVGGSFRAHRAVLEARCPALLTSECFEGLQATVLKRVLVFVYTGRVYKEPEFLGEVLAATDKLSLPELAQQCEQFFVESLSVETAATAAVLAITSDRPMLRGAAVQLIRRHSLQVIGTDGWKAAMRNHTEVAIQICNLVTAAAAAAADNDDNEDEAVTAKIRRRES